MKDNIKTLLEQSGVLSEEVKEGLNELINEQLEEVKTEAIQEAKNELEVSYAKKLTEEKQNLTEQVYKVLDEMVKEEIEELKEDINYYRNLEVQYATKLENFKEEYAEKLAESFNGTVEQLVDKEFKELKEDIDEVKKNEFGKTLYEAFANEFTKYGLGEDDAQLREQLRSLQEQVTKQEEVIKENERKEKIESLLEDLEGKSREIMKTILEDTATEKLEDRYNKTINSVLSENTSTTEKETVTESTSGEGTVVMENEEDEGTSKSRDDWSDIVRLATNKRR